jgi:hypothetical protein
LLSAWDILLMVVASPEAESEAVGSEEGVVAPRDAEETSSDVNSGGVLMEVVDMSA